MERDRGHTRKIPVAAAGVIVTIAILSYAGSTILTPLWVDALNNKTTNASHCEDNITTHKVDPYSMLLIVNVLCTCVFGFITVVTRLFCSSALPQHTRSYDKKEFAVVGFSDALAAMLILLASSGCRTAPYLQSLAANFSIPITFFLRFVVLQKRPTCRKLSCAFLVIIAEFTAILPDVFPGLESQRAKQEDGGASGLAGILWPVCYFFAFVPLAICSIILEKMMKSRSALRPEHHHNNDDGLEEEEEGLNVAYTLFWCYLCGLLTQLLLFGIDIIPGFGTTDNFADFGRLVWFNIRCFFGYEADCRGFINYVSLSCVILVILNRIIQTYFVKYLEGANLLAMIMTVPTPIAFLFYTLFDENPVKWHPHAYLSTYLSIIALCIMIPAIYIYVTGPPEVDYNKRETRPPEYTEEDRRPLLSDGPELDHVNTFHGFVNAATQAGNTVESGVQTSPTTSHNRGRVVHSEYTQNRHGLQRFESDIMNPRRTIQRRYTTADETQAGQNPNNVYHTYGNSLMNYRISSSWHAPEYSSIGQNRNSVFGNQSLDDIPTLTAMAGSHGNQNQPVRTNPFGGLSDEEEVSPQPTLTGPDFNIYQPPPQQQNIETQSNNFHIGSQYVEIDPEHQSAVHYNGTRAPNTETGQGDMAIDDETMLLLSDRPRSNPPSYSSLPQN